MYNQFKSISLSHRNATLAIREQLALNEAEAKSMMLRLKDFFDVSDVLVVSTCNRTEIYYSAATDLNEEIIKMLLIQKGVADIESFKSYFERFSAGESAVQHLFQVATGLQSQVVGDMQIPNQIKHAYQWSADLNMAGPFLHRLLHTIFFANKRVAQETFFRDGAASISYAAVELLEGLMPNPKVLIVGLGEIGADVCRNLAQKKGTAEVTIVNRSRDKSDKLAEELGFRVADFSDIEGEISRADIIVSSIVRDDPFFTKEMMVRLRGMSFKYFIDLSVPRSVSPEVEEIPGVMLYTIDSIRSKADQALHRRLEAVPHVREIIDEAVIEFNDWSKEMVVSPTIQKLKGALEQIRKEELTRFTKNLTDSELEKVERITTSMMQKILKLPVLQLKAACKRGEAETLIDVLNDLFNLEKQAEKH
ncbi:MULTISPECIES: glutamyl-tRNA reductase [Dyadobacter]|uniref:Glutamyl-tRNA reductase n=1 Tax=Dyadobacter chenhuakuii TaxID=2909339 RepID=A0A9X1QA40_9BACT|nr:MULTISPECIES: glutamyl-tRNA reductase [Dyadobacter]MCE7072041.1 glutamyl-tRNA reductase [Dyadobacter sp. CY327]MCF2494980.1 glutamyl-tRNA reductase [Dyadobacter chenhuakuii]MCF2498058.1 glutamyl-tRNA reductase [Dyadobacter chenhuakuii]MCF2518941.1 glutamyl-tRNA reductase [Dyadobacter sp. CY351]USJ31705.1 glutamyl-tRNA reductase [Dyadobacter chenhuakuii]